jgi:hypothetical protein
MPSPPSFEAARATVRALRRRPLHLLVLVAVALPLAALAPAPAGVVDGASGAWEVGRPAAASMERPTPHVVTVVDGLTVHLGVTGAPTVLEALQDLGVDRSPLDRVEIVEERVEVELPRELVRVEDPGMLLGYARVDRAGRVGTRIDTSLVLTVDGEVESRLTLHSETTREPVARVERHGTRTLEGDTVWDALARCEASGRWDAVRVVNSRITYHGGLQFDTRTWNEFRPDGFPQLASEATREQQIEVAERVLARQGWGAWPACSLRLGLR